MVVEKHLSHILEVDSVGFGIGINNVGKEEEGIRTVCQISKFISGLDGGGFFWDE